MGHSSWSDSAFEKLQAGRGKKDRSQIFVSKKGLDPQMDPAKAGLRESRDSAAHPNSRAIIVAFDVTASMGHIPELFAREKLGGLMRLLVERKYIADPQLLFAAVGDAESDHAPLQIGQFESGLEMDMWLTRMWLEGKGGDPPESYSLAYWFAANHTSIDCREKRGKKGYLFTIGDQADKPLTSRHVERVFGKSAPHASSELAVKAASASYELFHILVTRQKKPDPAIEQGWRKLLGPRLLVLKDENAVCEMIGVTIGLCERTVDKTQARKDLIEAGLTKASVEAVITTVSGAIASRG